MENEELKKCAEEFKKLPFAKSWENAYISKMHQILNTETEALEEKTIVDFLFIPGVNLLRHYGSDADFLRFRSENAYEDDWDYKLIDDKTDNNNRRMAVFYVSKILEPLDISFMVDNNYGIYVEIDELAQRAKRAKPENEDLYRSIYLNFSIPKTISTRVGATESWGN